ncbi:MAG: hypothetical protein HY901_35500, partial [Deltaproteobacteria bacterium]|nr:hypothetical protein [Deltaproteobacteria bacterium]
MTREHPVGTEEIARGACEREAIDVAWTNESRAVEECSSASRWVAFLLGAGHLAVCLAAGHLRPEHVVADVLVAGLPWLGGRAAAFAVGAMPMWLGVVLYDSQRLFLSLRGTVHTGDLMALELRLFPAPGGVIWSQWLSERAVAALDLLTG